MQKKNVSSEICALTQRFLSDVPSTQKSLVATPLGYFKRTSKVRDDAIIDEYASGGYSMKEVGDYFNLHYSRVSRIIKAKGKT